MCSNFEEGACDYVSMTRVNPDMVPASIKTYSATAPEGGQRGGEDTNPKLRQRWTTTAFDGQGRGPGGTGNEHATLKSLQAVARISTRPCPPKRADFGKLRIVQEAEESS
jgi:hypothetical protein